MKDIDVKQGIFVRFAIVENKFAATVYAPKI